MRSGATSKRSRAGVVAAVLALAATTPAMARASGHVASLDSLRAVAAALGEQGRGAFADTYGNLRIDPAAGTVTLYAVDAGRARALVDAARAEHPRIDTAPVRVVHAPYTKRNLDAQAARIAASTWTTRAADLDVYTIAVNPDASGITVTGRQDRVPALRARLAVSPVRVVTGDPVRAASWRWDGTAPQMSGDVLVGQTNASDDNEVRCTSGLATEDDAGHDYLLTADHCFRTGTDVHGEGDPVGQFKGAYGARVGTVARTSDPWDAELIDTGASDGGGSVAEEADQPEGAQYPVTRTAYSYNGDLVCQDGVTSYYGGHGVPCGIEVQNDDVTYNAQWSDGTTHQVRGVQGYNATWALDRGDSGALVFTVTGDGNAREARGSVSAMTDNQTAYWTEIPDILREFGQHLNPHAGS